MRLLLVFLLAGRLGAADWPSFRGPAAGGVAEGMKLPETWNGATGAGILWKTPIPGLAHSSPIAWGDRVFVTTAVSSRPGATFKPGLYGEGTASDDNSLHLWKVFCLDLKTGKVIWERTAYQGAPKEKRHIKATYANATPATDGRTVVALFGSQGLYGFDLDGKLLWSKDLGKLNAGAYDAADFEWGTASSPILYEGLVIVQCDQQKGSFLLAADARTGETVWKTERDELPSWGTPNVYTWAARPELVSNASNFIRGYDPKTGRELWRLGGSSKITAPTPVFTKELIFVASGRRPEAPLFAIRPGGAGDITGGGFVAWGKQQRGSYMPTPLVYREYLYVVGNAGILDCYDWRSGEEMYRQRIPHQGSGFSASPVAADGKIYLSSEDGDIFVVQAGRRFQVLATNPMGEPLMATPALSGRRMLVRGQRLLFAVGR